MKLKKLTITAVVAFLVAGTIGFALRESHRPAPQPQLEELPAALVVFCFHGNRPTARSGQIESLTHQVLQESFAKELKDGRLMWRVVNYEEPKNVNLVRECQVTEPSIILADGRLGKTRLWKGFAPRTWDMVDKPKAFMDLMRSEIRKSLK